MAIKKPPIRRPLPPVQPPVEPLEVPEEELPPVEPLAEEFPTTITEEGWEYSDIVWSEEGEPLDYMAVSPEGEEFTKVELDVAITQQEDYALIYANYQRTGGMLGVEDWIRAGTPLIPALEVSVEEQEARTLKLITDVFPDMTPEGFAEFITEDWEGFTESIITGGPTPEKEALLREMGFPPEEIERIFQPWFERLPPEGADIIMEIAGVQTMVHIESPNLQVWARDILIGRFTEGGEFHPSPKGLQEYLNLIYIEPPEVSRKQIDKDYNKVLVDIDKEYADIADWTVDGWQARRAANPERVQEWLDAQAKAWDDYQQALRPRWERVFTAGTGDVISVAAGVARWMGEDGIADRLTKYAERLQAQAPPDYMGEFEWSMMLNPRFYSTRVLRALPFTLSLAPAAIAGAYAATHIPYVSPYIIAHLGTYGKLILASLGAAALSRPLESAFEAGATYDDAIARGMTKEQADKAALNVFLGNLALGGWDAIQFAIAFVPIPGAPTASRFWKMAMVAGKLTIVGLTEAGEEAYQEVIQRWAVGDEVKLDAEMQQVMAIGGIFGIGLGGVGDVFTRIKDVTLENLTPEARATFDGDVTRFEAEGLTREQAELRAFDELAKTEEGGIATSDAIETVKIEGFDVEAARYREISEARVPVPEEVPAVPEVVVKPPVVEPLPAATEEIIGLPPTTEPTTLEVSENTQGLSEITAKEEVRPARKVFTKMGIWRDFYKPVQEAEVLINEEKQTYDKERRVTNKLIGKDADRRTLVWDEVNKKGSVVGLTFDEKRAVTRIREWADRWAERKNLPQSKRIKDYIPHLFEEEMIREIREENGLDPVLARILDEKFAGKITDPFLKKRLGKEIGLLKDPIAAMEAYDNVSLRAIHYAPLLNKINAYMADPNIPQGSREYLRNYARRMTGELSKADIALNKMTEEFANAIRKAPVFGERLYPYLTTGNPAGMASYNLTSALYGLWLGFKPTSAIRNLSQHTLILAEVGPIHFADAFRLRLTAEGRAALRESLVLRSRKLAFLPGIDSSFTARWSDKFREAALWLFRQADKQNVSDAFLAGYSEAKAKMPNATRQELIDYGDEVAANTQYLYTKMNSMAFAQNAPGRTLSMLTTWSENWLELMSKWIKRTPSQVFLEYEARTGEKVARANWATSYKAILLYMMIVGLGFAIKERTRLKAWEYTGITSVRYLADIMGGDFPALQAPGGAADVVVGFLTGDERRLAEGLYSLRTTFTPAVMRQLDSIAAGDKDWLTFFFYVEGRNIEIKRLKEKWEKGWKEYPIFEDVGERMAFIKEHKEYAGLTDAKMRNKWREENPLLEAQMFVVGQFTTLSTDEARAEVLRLIEEHKIDTELIDGYEKVFGIDTEAELKPFENRLGELEVLVPLEEAKYFTMGNYVSEVNALVKSVGRHKVQIEGSPLTVGILEAQDTFEAYEALEEGDTRTLWRQQYPEAEAWMYLLGKVSSFKNPKSAEILLGLMEKYNIPPEAIRAFLDDPSRYDDLFTQKFVLEQKWFDQTTEYENFGNTEAPNYIEDAELRKEARAQFKEDNPNWVADMRRIEAIDNDASEEIIEKWVDRGKTIDEFGAGSSQAKAWLLDNPESHKWALEKELLTDDGSDWNEPVLRINVQWHKLDNKYQGFGDRESDFYIEDDDARAEAREELLATNEDYRKDRYRRDAYGMDFPEIENYVDYYELDAKGFRQERMLLDNPTFANAMHEIAGIDLPKADEVPAVQYDDIYDQYSELFDKLDGLSDHKSPHYIENVDRREEARQTMRFDKKGNLTEFGVAEIRRNGYGKLVPEKHIETYVTYYSIIARGKPDNYEDINKTDLWYEDDWVLIENPEFYQEIYLGLLENEPRKLGVVPTREIFDKYLIYLKKVSGKPRMDYRWENPDLDAWGVLKFGWVSIVDQRRRAELTPTEKFLEDVLEKEAEFDKAMRELEELLRGLR